MTARRPVRVLIAGMGWSGRRWLDVASRMPEVEVRAVVSRSATRPDTRHGRLAGVPLFRDLPRALAAGDTDAAIICTEPGRQVADAAVAVRGGRAVIVEKPCGLRPASLDELAALAESEGVACLTGYHLAVNPLIQELAGQVRAGAFGAPRWASFRMHVDRGRPRRRWLDDPATSGGIMVETLVHGFHLAAHVLGPVARIETAMTGGRPADGVSRAFALLRHAGGCATALEAVWGGSRAVRSGFLEVLCDEGGFSVDRGFTDNRAYRYRADKAGALTEGVEPDDDIGFTALLHRLVRAVGGDRGAAEPVSLDTARRALELAVEARELARRARTGAAGRTAGAGSEAEAA